MIEKKDYSLLEHNTFKIDVCAKHFVEYNSEDELIDFLQSGKLKKTFLHIGEGSNLLFLNDYQGMVLHSAIQGVEVISELDDYVLVRVGAGMSWDDFVAHCVEKLWYGAENLSLIPGEVGAAAVQNIGAYGVEIKDLIYAVETVDIMGQHKTYSVADCEYAYRYSRFKKVENKHIFITRVILKLSKIEQYHLDYGSVRKELLKHTEVDLSTVRNAIIAIREEKLPNPCHIGNGGSFFMNPIVSKLKFEELKSLYPEIPYYELSQAKYKIPAAWMIDQCGWKGKRIGDAGVYSKQALVLVNHGKATGKDIYELAEAIRSSVKNKFGVILKPEVNYIGSDSI